MSSDNPATPFEIIGVLVQAQPERVEGVQAALLALPGVEFHGEGEAGRLVVTVEELEGEKHAVGTMTQISNLPGVLSTSLIFHHSEAEMQ